MRHALEAAAKNVAAGGRPFAAVVTAKTEIVGSGTDRSQVESDPTHHAELVAIREAAKAVGLEGMREATLYSTCEPCLMCACAVLRAGLPRVVFSSDRATAETLGFADIVEPGMSEKLLRRHVELVRVLPEEGRRLLGGSYEFGGS